MVGTASRDVGVIFRGVEGVDGDGAGVGEFADCLEDPEGYFAAVGDQEAVDRAWW